MRTFAFATAAVVVFAQLLPEALGEIGIIALPVFAVALLLPSTLERFAHAGHQRRGHTHPAGEHADDHAPGLELGYLGLVVHNFGDGLGIGTFGGPLGSSDLQLQIALSIAAHTIPVTALFVVAFATQRGVRSALERAVGLGVAMVAGALFASVVPRRAAAPFEPWIAAGVAGLLLHVIAHDWPVQRLRSRRERTLDLVAIVTGLTLVLLAGGHDAGGEHGAEHSRLAATLLGLALDTAPLLLLGLVAEAGRRALRPAPSHALATSSRFGLRPAAAALGAEVLVLSIGFLGFAFAAIRLIGALLIAIGGSALVKPVDRNRGPGHSDAAKPAAMAGNLDHLLFTGGAWMTVGLLAAGYAAIALPEKALAGAARGGLDVPLAAIAALPGVRYPAALVPLAAVLVGKGLSPGAALAGLLIAAGWSATGLADLRRTIGTQRTCAAIAGSLAIACLLGLGLNASQLSLDVGPIGRPGDHGALSWIALLLVAVLFVRTVWRSGLRAWLAGLSEDSAAHL